MDNPANAVKDATSSYTMLPPHWKTDKPIPVKAGTGYRLLAWGGAEIVTVGQGYDGIVRWVDASGMPVSQQVVFENRSASTHGFELSASPRLVAPAGAVGAVLLLGHTDDLWTGQVYFDDVYFGTYN